MKNVFFLSDWRVSGASAQIVAQDPPKGADMMTCEKTFTMAPKDFYSTSGAGENVFSMRSWLVFLLLLSVSIAGCLGGDDLDEGETEGRDRTQRDGALNLKLAEETELEQQLEALEIVPADDPEWDRPNVTARDWLLLSTPTTPEGTVAAFKWEFPLEALTANDELLLDVAVALDPMGHPEGLPEGMDWLFMVVLQRYDEEWAQWETYTSNSWIEMGMTRTRIVERFDGGPSVDVTTPAPSAPFRTRVVFDEEIHNQTLYFVLAARGPAGEEFGMGIRMMGAGQHSANWEAFQGNFEEEQAPLVPERVLTGSGLYLADYFERHVVGDRNSRIITPDVGSVSESLSDAWYPYFSTRSVSFNIGTDWGGWSDLRIVYASSVEYGEMEIDIDLHGTTERKVYRFFGQFVPEGFTPLVDPPLVRMTVDGDSPSSIAVELTKSGTLISEELRISQFSIGVSLQEITGLPYQDQVFAT
jgi:hypothetical protein